MARLLNGLFALVERSDQARARRTEALWALLTGESLTTARQALDPGPFRTTSLEGLAEVQGFVSAGSVLPEDIRRMAKDVADGAFPPTDPPRWPGLEALARADDTEVDHLVYGLDNGHDEGSALGRVQATRPTTPVTPYANLGGFWERPRRRVTWGQRFDYGVLVAAVCIAAFFGLRVLASPTMLAGLLQ